MTGDHVIVCVGADVDDRHLAELAGDGVSYVAVPSGVDDLAIVLETLASAFGIGSIALEGGGIVNGHFLAQGLVDEVRILVAPALDGMNDADGIVVHQDGLKDHAQLSFEGAENLEKGLVLLKYRVTIDS